MKTLYINTATTSTTIALYDHDKVLAERRWNAEQKEAEKLQPAVEALLKEQDVPVEKIDRLVVCVGPGGFTSVRVGVSAVNAWAFAMKLPVGQVSVFDLYESAEALLVVSANSNEGWVKWPGKAPEFVRLEELKLPGPFLFGGLLHEDWQKTLQSHDGTFLEIPEALPQIDRVEFQQVILKPWYYKDANITWSTKHDPVRRLNPDR